jgi:hypothetical protein
LLGNQKQAFRDQRGLCLGFRPESVGLCLGGIRALHRRWHVYPFQPRQQVDWLCTGLLFVLGTGIVWVFAQMYLNPILSRITDTRPNELGWEFYLRIVAFGAIPVLTWLAYQFPDFGNMVFKLFQPAVDVMKCVSCDQLVAPFSFGESLNAAFLT